MDPSRGGTRSGTSRETLRTANSTYWVALLRTTNRIRMRRAFRSASNEVSGVRIVRPPREKAMRRWRLLWCAVLATLLPAPCSAQIADVLLAQGIRRSPSPEAEPAPAPSPPPAAADVPHAEPAPPPPAEEPLGFAGRSLTLGPTATSPDFVPILDRWRIGMPNWNRFDRPVDSPFARGRWWDPYNQNVLKGDYPIFGQDIFLNVSAILDTVVNFRSIPTPSNVSAARAGAFDFFGRGDQIFFSSYAIASIELFKGDSAFRPRDWEFRITPVFNVNYLSAEENGVVNIDVRRGTTRLDEYISLQELLVEYHLADLSPNYDFISTRAGIQLFQSDFRGFIFSDSQLGARLFGNFDANRYQFNAAYFRPLEKDTNSGLNRLFDFRGQNLFIANLFRQDLIWPGYTAMVNLHYLNDAGDTHFDRNGFLTRPAPIGTLAPKVVNAVWLGWNGDGHIGPLNITHAFYQVLGGQDDDPIGGQGQRHLRPDGRHRALHGLRLGSAEALVLLVVGGSDAQRRSRPRVRHHPRQSELRR